uniref:Uncharacterized protein n=1 Tax=Triticum urartu TaxID=4572 RepID=A0A8R7P058_TRIUA
MHVQQLVVVSTQGSALLLGPNPPAFCSTAYACPATIRHRPAHSRLVSQSSGWAPGRKIQYSAARTPLIQQFILSRVRSCDELQGAVRVPGAQDRVPRGGVLEPRLLRGAGGVRGRRRRRGAGGPHGVAGAGRRQVDEDEGVVGLRLAPRLQPPPPGALLHPHPQRVRQDARRQQGHPGQLEAQHLLPLLRPVQLNPP